MKTNRIFQTILAAAVIALLTLSWTANPTNQSALAEGGGVAVTGEKILVSLSNNATNWNDDTLYAINPSDGGGQTKVYDFHNFSNTHYQTGEIWAPRVSADGKQIYFHSTHTYLFTPAGRNAFRVASDGSGIDQITPGEKSGIWGQTGNSTVSGQVRKWDDSGWANAPVYLEGMDMIYSDASGNFSFSNVPSGARWLVAYEPGNQPFDSTPVNVVSGVNNTGLTLKPSSSWRMNFQYPVAYGDRVYYRLNSNQIQWTDLNFSAQHDIYTTPADSCTGIPNVDAFDVGRATGKIAVFDYQEGCGVGNNNHNGIYIIDKDGNNKQLLADILNTADWSEALQPEVFWSPDESKIAFKGVYQWYQVLVVLDASNSNILGLAYANTTSEVVTLHGWNPAGNWLLFSVYDGNAAQATLSKLKLNTDGSFDFTSGVDLLTNQPISGATWGNLSDPGSPNPTPTTQPTATTAPSSASVSVNYSTGQQGSSFIVSGQNFAARSSNATLTVSVNGTSVGSISASGNFNFTLNTDSAAAEGPYIVAVSDGTSSASTLYALSASAPLRSDTSGDTLSVPASIGAGHRVYLPVVIKN